LLKGRQEEILDRAKTKRASQGDPKSNAEFKRDKRSKRATEAKNERDQHTTDLKQLRVVDNSPDAVEDPKPIAGKLGSSRSAAFLKLVVNVGNETNP
ncbi:transposase, partial [Pseudomonas sp. SST3]|nr:transposase [Pseudomonas sp. SST3]